MSNSSYNGTVGFHATPETNLRSLAQADADVTDCPA